MSHIKKIVITGGPCAGKTTVFNHLKERYSDKVIFIPEAATKLFNEGYPREGAAPSPQWQNTFQTAVMNTQKELEVEAAKEADATGKTIMVCDRGTLDGGAYTIGGRQAFCDINNLDPEEIINNYDTVIHLESTAVGDPESYGNDSNTHRLEGIETAAKLDQAIWDAWEGHPQHIKIRCDGGVKIKQHLVDKEIQKALGG
jgi:thymidylate kinase